MPRIISVIGLFCVLFVGMTAIVSAQTSQDISLGIANDVVISGKNIKDGDIVSSTEKGYILSSTPYDPLVIGVVAVKPALAINVKDSEPSTFPVLSSGNVKVNVTSSNGDIKIGDLITSSAIPGKGMKSTQTGYVMGRALDAYSSKDKQAVGSINISLNLHYSYSSSKTQSSLKDILNLSTIATYESPSAVFKYVVAGIIIISSFILGVISFGRVANTGVEALGRNPLAGKMIQFGILVNVLITLSIIAAGFGIAFLIIRL